MASVLEGSIREETRTKHLFSLHREIEEFYDFVRPTIQQQNERHAVLARIQKALISSQPFQGSKLLVFGSSPTNLYLPGGDLDCTLVMQDYNPNEVDSRAAKTRAANTLKKARAALLRVKITDWDGCLLIAKARVPLLKFSDAVSGIKVDLSINNPGGLKAVDTVKKWARTWPALPRLLMVLKRFLEVRELNDVALQGLGSFSLICLIVTYLRYLPGELDTNTTGSTASSGYGALLLGFLNHYGNEFDRTNVAIRMDDDNFGYCPKPPVRHSFWSLQCLR